MTVSASVRMVSVRRGLRPLWTTSLPPLKSRVTPSSMSVTQMPTRAFNDSKSRSFSGWLRMLASIRPRASTQTRSVHRRRNRRARGCRRRAWGLSRWAWRSQIPPHPPASLLLFVGPFDRNPRRAERHLLRSLRVAHDRRQVTLQLELALEHPLGGVELVGGDLFPPRVRRVDHEVALLRIGRGADLDVARLAVEQVHHDSLRLGEVVGRLGFDHEANRPLPALARRLVGGRFVDLVLERLGPLVRESLDRHAALLTHSETSDLA